MARGGRTGTEGRDGRAELVSVVTRGETTYALVLMAGESAASLDLDLESSPPARVLNSVEREIERLRESAPELADGALAASMVAMALEIENPYNSATSKSMCQARLAEGLKELRLLSPTKKQEGVVHDIRSSRARRLRLAGGSGTED